MNTCFKKRVLHFLPVTGLQSAASHTSSSSGLGPTSTAIASAAAVTTGVCASSSSNLSTVATCISCRAYSQTASHVMFPCDHTTMTHPLLLAEGTCWKVLMTRMITCKCCRFPIRLQQWLLTFPYSQANLACAIAMGRGYCHSNAEDYGVQHDCHVMPSLPHPTLGDRQLRFMNKRVGCATTESIRCSIRPLPAHTRCSCNRQHDSPHPGLHSTEHVRERSHVGATRPLLHHDA